MGIVDGNGPGELLISIHGPRNRSSEILSVRTVRSNGFGNIPPIYTSDGNSLCDIPSINVAGGNRFRDIRSICMSMGIYVSGFSNVQRNGQNTSEKIGHEQL